MPGASLIGNLAVTLGLNTAAFERGATKAEARAKTLQGRLSGIGSSITGLAAGIGVAVGVTALTTLARNAFEMASALDESSQKVGVTVEALQELNLAAKQNGISEESLAGALQKMNKAIGGLEQGSKPAVAAFAKLGLSFEDLKGKAPEQQLRIIADALNKLPDVQQRVAVGVQIMGRSFSELLPLINGGSAALDKYAETSRNNGQITTEEAKRLDALADSWDRLKVRVGVFAAKLIATFAELADKLDGSLAKWYAWRDGIIGAVGSMATNAINALNNLMTGVRTFFVNGLGQVLDWAKDKIQQVGDKFKWLYDVTVGHSYIPDMIDGIGRSMGELGRIMVDPALSATEKVAAAFQSLAGTVSGLFGRKTGGILGSILNLVSAVAPLFGGVAPIRGANLSSSMPVSLGSPTPLPSVRGFARGGSGTFGGFGGVDKNVLSMNGKPFARVSRGEHFSVSRNNAANQPYFDLRGAVMTTDLVNQMNQIGTVATGRGAMMGAAGAEERRARRARRMIP